MYQCIDRLSTHSHVPYLETRVGPFLIQLKGNNPLAALCQYWFIPAWVISYVSMSHVSHVNEWMSHVAHVNESWLIWEWVMSHMWMSHVSNVNAWMSHVAHVHEWICHVTSPVLAHTCASYVPCINYIQGSVDQSIRI